MPQLSAPKWVAYNYRNLFSGSFKGRKSKSKLSAALVPSGGFKGPLDLNTDFSEKHASTIPLKWL